MKEPIKIYINAYHWTFERVDGNYFNLVFYGATKNGEGNQHRIYIKLDFAFTGYLIRELKENLNKQIKRYQSYFKA
jgi:hypothetical protein